MHSLSEESNTILSCNLYNTNHISLSIGGQYGLHCHRGLEFCYVHTGTGICKIGERSYKLKKNSLFFLRPFQIHGFFQENKSIFCRSIIVVDIELLLHASTAFPKIKQFIRFLHSEKADMPYFDDSDKCIENLILSASIYTKKYNKDLPAEDAILLSQGIVKVLSHNQERLYIGDKEKEKKDVGAVYVSALIKWVDENLGEEYSLERLSRHLGISKFYLTRLFKKHMGITIGVYIQKRRLREAKILLYTCQLPITEIAGRTGFSDLSYFCQVFRRDTGMTPKEFRINSLDKLA